VLFIGEDRAWPIVLFWPAFGSSSGSSGTVAVEETGGTMLMVEDCTTQYASALRMILLNL